MAVTKRTIFNYFGSYYYCVSTDEKPTNAKVNDRILELDTAREYFWDGSEWVLCGSVVYYPISATVTNGTASGATKIASGQTVEVTIAPASGYALPTSVTVEGATASYNATTGVISLSEVTGDVSITAACAAVYAISVSVTNGTYSGDTNILDGGTANVTIAADTDYVLPSSITVSGASYTYNDTTGAIALSEPTGAVSIAAVCEVPQSYPVKGDIINIDMDGDGTDEEYTVLKSVGSDNVVEVLARVRVGIWTLSNTLLNLSTTVYDSFSSEAKDAIIEKAWSYDSWYRSNDGTPQYVGYLNLWGSPFEINFSLSASQYGTVTNRKLWLVTIQDLVDYFGVTPGMTAANTTWTTDNLNTLFSDISGVGHAAPWTGSYSAADTSRSFCLYMLGGNLESYKHDSTQLHEAYPAFRIDLDKITWSPVQ